MRKHVPPEDALPRVRLALARLVRMHAGRHGVAIVCPDRSGTAGEGREQKNGAECGKKNGSHICMLV